MKALHHRFFEFFDLSRSILVETETVRDARDLELWFRRKIKDHQAPSPLVVRREAAGHTEWYRGAYDNVAREAISLSANGYVVHVGLDKWVRNSLITRSDQLYTWAAAILTIMDPESSEALPPAVRDTLDAYEALDIDIAPLLPEAMWRWYRRTTGCRAV